MRKFIITCCIIGSAIIILSQFGFFEALLLFLLAGIIPGTSYSLSSHTMSLLTMSIISLIIVWFVGLSVFEFLFSITQKAAPVASKQSSTKHLPKQRYSQI